MPAYRGREIRVVLSLRQPSVRPLVILEAYQELLDVPEHRTIVLDRLELPIDTLAFLRGLGLVFRDITRLAAVYWDDAVQLQLADDGSTPPQL